MQVFQKEALAAGKLRDDIVNKHVLLLFIDFIAGWCKQNQQGKYIPNTCIGAVSSLVFFESGWQLL